MKACSKWLPKFMLPNEIILDINFPFLSSGKVDKERLREIYKMQHQEMTIENNNPKSKIWNIVKSVLFEMFGEFPENKRLSAIGLDSLNTIIVASKLRGLGLQISTISVLLAEDINEIVSLCIDNTGPSSSVILASTERENSKSELISTNNTDEVESIIPCTPLQIAMILKSVADTNTYQNWIELSLPATDDCVFLTKALYELAEFNPILRTGFVESEGPNWFVQIIRPKIPDSCIKSVKVFDYELEYTQEYFLKYPVRFQILSEESSLKVLVHIHHALYDAWSLELLLDDLESLLSMNVLLKRPSFESVVDSYQKSEIFNSKDSSSMNYWKQHLLKYEPRGLPNFQTRISKSRGLAAVELESSFLSSELEKAARSLSTSSQSFFQTALALTLASYLGSSDVCFGTVFSGRTLPVDGIENIVGPCLTTLPIRIDVSTSRNLSHLIQKLNSINKSHLEYSQVPLQKIKIASDLEPSQSLFDTVLIWQQTFHAFEGERKKVLLVDAVDNLEFDLTLEITPLKKRIEIKATYRQSLLPESQALFFIQQIENIVGALILEPEASSKAIFSSLSRNLLSIENGSPEESWTNISRKTLYSSVEDIALTNPDKLAVSFAHSLRDNKINVQNLTYSELNSQANQIANCLVELGVISNMTICVYLDISLEIYTLILAITKIGACFCPIMPDISTEHLDKILEKFQAMSIVTKSDSRSFFETYHHSKKVIYIDELHLSDSPAENLSLSHLDDSYAYVISNYRNTGITKEVFITQTNILTHLLALESINYLTKNSRLLQSFFLDFIMSLSDIFLIWRMGGCLCSAKSDMLLANFEAIAHGMQVTHLSLTPAIANLIDPKNVPHVQQLTIIGEVVSPKILSDWTDRDLRIGYGRLATTSIVTVSSSMTQEDSIDNIGYLLKNTSAFVLLPEPEGFFPTIRGGVGELCFAGSQIGHEFINKCHEECSYLESSEFGRIYRTGDIGRLMPGGSFVYLGRKRDRIEIKGYKFDLGEIASQLLSKHPNISNCKSVAIKDENKIDLKVVCFWTSASKISTKFQYLETDLDLIRRLYQSLCPKLRNIMIPSAIIQISSFPIKTSGKIDQSRLIQLFHSLPKKNLDSINQIREPLYNHQWSQLEEKIASALSEATGKDIQDIGPDISFYRLGLDSISAVFFSRILQKKSGYQVLVSEILYYPTVIDLSKSIISSNENSKVIEPCSRSAKSNFSSEYIATIFESYQKVGKQVEEILSCTPLQEAMLSATEVSCEDIYDNHVIFEVNGDIDKLLSCWNEMIQRHQILRTCFEKTDSVQYPYAQVVLSSYNLQPDFLSCLSEKKSYTSKFEPLYSIKILRDSTPKIMVLSMHHALYDQAALSILYDEIQSLYHGQALTPVTPFSPFLSYIDTIDRDAADIFWRRVLKNCKFPKFLPKTGHQLKAMTTETHHVTTEYSLNFIKMKSMKYDTSVLSILLTIWACIISERLLETDVCFGTVFGGRSIQIPGIDRLVAPCFNTVPSRLENMDNICYLQAFHKLKELIAETIPFQFSPLRKIQSKVSPDGSHIFDTLLILQNQPQKLDPSIWSIVDENLSIGFTLVCEIIPHSADDNLEINLHYCSSTVSNFEAIEILTSFQQKLNEALDNPQKPLVSLTVKEKISKKLDQLEETSTQPEIVRTTPECRSDVEKCLLKMISNYTDIPASRITCDTSIFKLGLDSISAIQVASRLRKQGFDLMASDIVENPTISRLASFLEDKKEPISVNTIPNFEDFKLFCRDIICSKYKITLGDIEAIRPCTMAQQGMIARTLHSGGKEYMNAFFLEIRPEISLTKLKKAFKTACQIHEIFRSGLASIDDKIFPFVMVTRKEVNLPWFESELRDFGSLEIDERLFSKPWSIQVKNQDDKITLEFSAHHALFDAQSIQMFFLDVSKLYRSVEIESRPPINSLLGAIISQNQSDLEQKKQFWGRDENKIIVNPFPSLTPIQSSDKNVYSEQRILKLSVLELEQKCRMNSVTIQAATQASWARLLAFYVGESSTTFGISLSGRSICENADSISFPSAITLPTRCNVMGTNTELLARTMRFNSEVLRHQFTPLTLIQKWTGSLNSRMFDTLFLYHKMKSSSGKSELPWKVRRETSFIDCAVSLEVVSHADNRFSLHLSFGVDLIPVEQARIILEQYEVLLLDILSNPDNICASTPQSPINILSVTAPKNPFISCPVTLLHQFVERGARLYPEKVALEFVTNFDSNNISRECWKYEELNDCSNQVANYLLDRHIGPGNMVATCFDKCAEASFAFIGILKAGCVYLALDPTAPIDRLKFILKDSNAKILLTSGKFKKKLAGLANIDIIDFDRSLALSYSKKSPKLVRSIEPEDTSYCLYTSGTTGTPKGCLITHENAVQFMLAFSKIFEGRWNDDSKYLQFASFHFDVSVMEQFWSWSEGLCVVSAPRDLILEDLSGAIQKLGITHIDLTPSLAQLLHPNDVPSLCRGAFVVGGEKLKQEILDLWGKHECIYNGYGPTEATIGCTMYPRVPENGNISNIGPAYINVGSFVLAPGTESLVLRGGVGELCISGKLVGKGYLNLPDLTAEKFPTLKVFNERVYRTGDLVRILHDGSFNFIGRVDDQVKLRGQRLELNEINEVIKQIKSIHEVVTSLVRNINQDKDQLVAFFRTDLSDLSSLIPTIRERCRYKLPEYMVPSHFIPIKQIPLNSNNKADFKQLCNIFNELTFDDLQVLHSSGERIKAWSHIENEVVSKISSAIGLDICALTRSTNIFEAGLDSISIIQFCQALQNSGLKNAKLSVVKNNPCLHDLVGVLLQKTQSDENERNKFIASSQRLKAFSHKHMVNICDELEIDNSLIEAVTYCTPLQEGMIYRFLESEHAIYFNKFQFQLSEGIEEQKLLIALNRVVSHLEILRVRFVATEDGFAQVVLKDKILTWVPIQKYEALDKISALRSPYSMNYDAGILSLCMFHGLYDGYSFRMLFHHIIDEYFGVQNINYGPSFIESLPYGPLATITGAEEFWKSHLVDWSPFLFTENPSSNDVNVTISRVIYLSGFENLRRKLRVTAQAIIQACWITVLQKKFSRNLTVGVLTSGRSIDLEGADTIVGPLFNVIPYNSKLKSGIQMTEIISHCHKFNISLQDFQHTPLKEIQKWAPLRNIKSLFEIIFNFQRADHMQDKVNNFCTEIEVAQIFDFPLALEAELGLDNTSLSLKFFSRSSIIAEDSLDDLASQMEQLIGSTLSEEGTNYVIHESKEDMSNAMTVKSLAQNSEELPTKIEEFTWTKETLALRKEMALLAKVPQDVVDQNSGIFELGLDSIDTIKLSSRMKIQGVDISVRAIIKLQTISRMAPYLDSKIDSLQSSTDGYLRDGYRELKSYFASMKKPTGDFEEILPATPFQEGIIKEMMSSSFQRYFNINGYKIGSLVDSERLIGAIRKVIEISPILRTTFLEIDDPGVPIRFALAIQKMHGDEIETETLSPSETGSIYDYLNHFKKETIIKASQSFKLFHIRLVVLGPERFLAIAISHALYDGTSLSILHEDIKRAYDGLSIDRPDFRPYLEQSFLSRTKDAEKFWRTMLSNLPTSVLSRKYDSVFADSDAKFMSQRPSRIPLSRIEAACRSSRITLQTLGQTCWALVISQLTQNLDVVFGSILSCRDSEEATRVMFPLMNTVAVRSVIHGSLNDMLTYMQEMNNKIRKYQHFPLGRAQNYALGSRGGRSRENQPFFDTIFIYQGRIDAVDQNPLYESIYQVSNVEFLICAEMRIESDNNLWWAITCKEAAHNQAETEMLVEALDKTLERLISSKNSQSTIIDGDSVSVCGLPSFKLKHVEPMSQHEENSTPLEVESWSSTEMSIRTALSIISRVPEKNISKHMTIFHLGLDSILVLKLPALLKTFGIQIKISSIMRDQTIAAMAITAQSLSLATHKFQDEDSILATIKFTGEFPIARATLEEEIGNIEYIIPATAGQCYIIRQWQVSGGVLFDKMLSFTVPQPLIQESLASSWRKLLATHDILRTGFVEDDGKIFQVIFRDPSNPIVYTSEEVDRNLIRSRDLRFPPLDLCVEMLPGKEVKLHLSIHHVIYDGVSLPLLLEELKRLYHGEELVAMSCLGFKSLVLQSFAASQSLDLREKWQSYLPGETFDLEPATSGEENCRTEVYIPSTEIQDMRLRAQNIGSSVDALFLAALAKIKAQRIQHASPAEPVGAVILGLYLANRAPFGEDLSQLAAPTLNVLPLCIHEPLEKSLESLALEIQADIQRISSSDMVFASLSQIYEWTGVRVEIFVNILKPSIGLIFESGGLLASPLPSVKFGRDRPQSSNSHVQVYEKSLMPRSLPKKEAEAYLPPIDIELRYHDGTVDMGIFACQNSLTPDEAKSFATQFLDFWGF
ncbi:nonribosomal peptide synthetase/nonribosomal siderophore peptide synthase [Blumeria hordei DH14]|uniref:Nonribosomal peptide synthetase/nonribosomal siderophore peptide synthase n=1 Tax=Blumeria graminis f. sp. hordei (strain DH14) TaxID=546991 RepID=N1JA19_BLUG1|nr:nonribosomal peptide synthetase/nonribosomal siderophore peptide synthase [Blumeria hordei DH14]